jgi:uncharacterized protein (TIGR02147 family)
MKLSAHQIIQKHYHEIQRVNPSYSIRAFAKKLQVSSGALSEILAGKRRLTESLAKRIISRLAMRPRDARRLMLLVQEEYIEASCMGEDTASTTVPVDEFELISQWEHFAILSLTETKGFKSDVKWIAERLGISFSKAKRAILRLESLGHLVNEGGKLKRKKTRLQSSDDIINISVRRSHYGDLDLAKRSLDRDDISIRDFTSITLPADTHLMEMAKKKIRRFQDEMESLFEGNDCDEVYRMNIQLYPLTKIEGQKENL